MTLPDKDHPVWPLTRWIVVSVTIFLFLKYNYISGFVAKDWVTLFGTIGVLAGFDWLKKAVTKTE